MPMFRSAYHGTYTVSGVPVVTNDLASTITGSIAGLLVAALLRDGRGAAAGVPEPSAAAAARDRAGGGRDHVRRGVAGRRVADDGLDRGAADPDRAGGRLRGPVPGATEEAVAATSRSGGDRRGAPTIATAALATAAGFLALLLSPVPMVRGFGELLIVGIAIALACALTAGSAALVLSRRRRAAIGSARWRRAVARRRRRVRARRGGDHRRRRRAGRLAARGLGRALGGRGGGAPARPRAARRAGAGRALGWVADTQMPVQSDVTKLVPSNMPALRDLRTLERVTGVSGEIDVLVHSSNVATPKTIGWMVGYENTLLAHFGYVEAKGCARGDAVPGAVAARPVLLGQPGDERLVRQLADHRPDLEPAARRCRRTSPRR